MKIVYFLFLFSVLQSAAFAQTRLEAQGGNTPCEWSDKNGHRGKTICRIIEQGTINGQTSSVISVINRNLAYKLDYDNYRAELVNVSSDRYKTLWNGRFTSKYAKRDPFFETISISDGVTLTIRRF